MPVAVPIQDRQQDAGKNQSIHVSPAGNLEYDQRLPSVQDDPAPCKPQDRQETPEEQEGSHFAQEHESLQRGRTLAGYQTHGLEARLRQRWKDRPGEWPVLLRVQGILPRQRIGNEVGRCRGVGVETGRRHAGVPDMPGDIAGQDRAVGRNKGGKGMPNPRIRPRTV